jgi:hypothetical protein
MMADTNKVNKAVEQVANSTRDSLGVVMDHTVGLQERNVRFAQGVTDNYIKELRHQGEANRAMTRDLAERAEGQRDAFQAVAEQALDTYMDFLYAPLSYYKEGLQVAGKAAR